MPGSINARPDGAARWRDAVVYQIYIRSFADGNGDGIGDIAGIRQHLPYLRDLGVDALWITPWYVSPMADGGYDVADYRNVDPMFGTLDDADGLLADAHAIGLRVLIDIVPNHTSDRHSWFQEALASKPGSAARARYDFAEGLGGQVDDPPNNWPSVFGGPAWGRVIEADGRPGQWYLHVFAPEQPDLNWDNLEVLHLYRAALAIRRRLPGFRGEGLEWLASPPGTLRFRRADDIECAVNLSADALPLPSGGELLISTAGDSLTLPRDTAAWYLAGTEDRPRLGPRADPGSRRGWPRRRPAARP